MKIPPVAERISTGEGSSTNFTKYLLEKSCKDCFRYSPRDFFSEIIPIFQKFLAFLFKKIFKHSFIKSLREYLRFFPRNLGNPLKFIFENFSIMSLKLFWITSGGASRNCSWNSSKNTLVIFSWISSKKWPWIALEIPHGFF